MNSSIDIARANDISQKENMKKFDESKLKEEKKKQKNDRYDEKGVKQ